jgi:anti-sigma factor RsiW
MEDAMALPTLNLSVSASPSKLTHRSEDDLESYVMGRMPATDQAHLEGHVLACKACRERLEETSRFIEAFKSALSGARPGVER